jgi:Transposase IS66 family
VLVAKYCDPTPLYRQSAIYGRAGVELERSTLANWVGQAAFLLEPLAAAIAQGALERMAALFKIEAEINGHASEHRHTLRQERSLPLLADLKDFLAAALASISRKSSLAGAIRYSLAPGQRFAGSLTTAGSR